MLTEQRTPPPCPHLQKNMFKRIEQFLKLNNHNLNIKQDLYSRGGDTNFKGWNTEDTFDPSGDLFKTYVEDKRVSSATIEDKLKNLQNSTPPVTPPTQDLRNLYTVHCTTVTPQSVHNITVLLSHLKVYTIKLYAHFINSRIATMNQRRTQIKHMVPGGSEVQYVLGYWKKDSVKEHRDYAVNVCTVWFCF